MTRDSHNSIPSVDGEDFDENGDALAEMSSKKNRERFAINKSYSIEVYFKAQNSFSITDLFQLSCMSFHLLLFPWLLYIKDQAMNFQNLNH